jgi:HEAT repeat protein
MAAPIPSKGAAPASPGPAEQKAERLRDQVLALDVKRVADWIGALVRTIKASRTYPANNPTLHKFQVELESRTWSCLKEVGDITLTVQQFDLLFENYSVYHNADRNESLAFRFHGDGVREITFKEGLEPHELRAFLDVLRRAVDSAPVQDDVVTLLWERDFGHITYAFVPLEDLADSATEYAASHETDADGAPDGANTIPWPRGGEEEPPPQGEVSAGEAGPAPVNPERSDDWVPALETSPSWGGTIGVQFSLDEQENAALAVSLQEEEHRALATEVLEIVATILAAETTPAGFLESAGAFQRFVELAIEEGDIVRANELIAMLRGIAATHAKEHAEFNGLADQVIKEVGRPSFLGQMAPTLNSLATIDPAVLTNFLVQLGPSAAPAICDLLGQVNHMKYRRALCEALSTSCKDDVEVLIERLSDSRWYVIRNIVYVLGRIAHQGVERALDRALHHEDVRVRKEAVRALGNIESPTSRAYLVSAFRDSDQGVRIQAAMTLALRRDDRSAQAILGLIQGPDFSKRDSNERQAYFEALGRCGSDNLVPRLEPILTRGGLFRSGNDEERLHAALALAWLGTPAALGVLNREMGSKRDFVRRSVETALNTVRKTALGRPAEPEDTPENEETEG